MNILNTMISNFDDYNDPPQEGIHHIFMFSFLLSFIFTFLFLISIKMFFHFQNTQ
jgi:hypothetical protein